MDTEQNRHRAYESSSGGGLYLVCHAKEDAPLNPVSAGIEQYAFLSREDGSQQTFLCKDFRPSSSSETPLLAIYLHGALAHQSQGMSSGIFEGAFENIAKDLAARSAVYLCPEYRGNSWMGPLAEADLLQMVDLAQARFRPDKTVLFGASMGGTSTLIFAARHRDRLDGVIAFCPASDMKEMFRQFPDQFRFSYGGDTNEMPLEYERRSVRRHPGALNSLPVVIVHGTADAVISIEHSRALTETLKNGTDGLQYIEIEGGDHNTPLSEPFAELLDFILR